MPILTVSTFVILCIWKTRLTIPIRPFGIKYDVTQCTYIIFTRTSRTYKNVSFRIPNRSCTYTEPTNARSRSFTYTIVGFIDHPFPKYKPQTHERTHTRTFINTLHMRFRKFSNAYRRNPLLESGHKSVSITTAASAMYAR